MSYTFGKSMAPILLAVVLILGVSGTAVASESARPGDILYPIDRAVENIRLALSDQEDMARLRSKFADERLAELKDILDEEAVATSTVEVAAEAGTTATTSSSTKTKSGRVISGDSELRVAMAVDTIVDFFNQEDFDSETRDRFLNQMLAELADVNVQARVSKNRVKFASNDENWFDEMDSLAESRIEIKSGQDRVPTRENDDDNYTKSGVSNLISSKDWSNDSDKTEVETKAVASSSVADISIEADVYTDVTVIKFEMGGQKSTFEITAKNEDEVIAEIVSRLGLSREDVMAALDFQVKGKALNLPANLIKTGDDDDYESDVESYDNHEDRERQEDSGDDERRGESED